MTTPSSTWPAHTPPRRSGNGPERPGFTLNPALLPGVPGEVRLVDIGDPGRPQGRMVRVRMLRAPVNPADVLAIDGRYAFPVAPDAPLGAEGVGRVEAVGDEVVDLAPGDAVLPLSRGNWCATRLIDRSALIPLPPAIDIAQAAMLRINPATACLILDALDLRAGDAIVQNAASSSVAGWVRLFAARRRVAVVDVVRRADAALPDALIDGPDLSDRVAAVTGRTVRGALDCIAGDATGRLAACLDQAGRVVVFGHLSGAPVTIASTLLTGGGLSVVGFSLRPAEAALGKDRRTRLFDEILSTLPSAPPPVVQAVFPFARAAEAIALARAGGRGRVQLTP